jgi:hypothetical protein
VFRRPELLVAASVPVLLVAGVLSWHRDVLCTQSGCGTVAASALTGSPVWAALLVVALVLAGAWVLLLPSRRAVPLVVAAVTAVAGVVSAAVVLVSLGALVFNQPWFFGFHLPVTESFPVLAVHPGPGLLLGLLGVLLQATGGWTSVRRRTVLTFPSRRQATSGTGPWTGGVPGWSTAALPARPSHAAARSVELPEAERRTVGVPPVDPSGAAARGADPGGAVASRQWAPAPRRHHRRA